MIKKISIIAPAHNEAGNITEFVSRAIKAMNGLQFNSELILIDDGSTDSTLVEMKESSISDNRIKVLKHLRRFGLSEALNTGFHESLGDVIIFLCTDLSSDPVEDVPKLISGILEGHDMVCGRRSERRELKLFVSLIYNWFGRKLFHLKIHDQNWIKAFRRNIVENLRLKPGWHRFLSAIASELGYDIAEVETNYYPRRHGRSKYGIIRILIGAADLISIKIQFSLMEKPFLIFGTLGILLFTSGCILGGALSIADFFFGANLSDVMVLVILDVLLLIVGIGFFNVGLLAEYIIGSSVIPKPTFKKINR